MSGLRLIAAAPTAAQRRAIFSGDDDLDEGGIRAARALRPLMPRGDPWRCGASRAARSTARELGAPHPVVVAALADPDHGRWAGRGLDDVAATDPAGVRAWLSDPDAAPHGGESLTAITARAAAWLDQHTGDRLVAVAHPVVVRAVLAAALGLGPGRIRQLDVAPLALTRLTHHAGRWHLHLPTLTP